MLKLKRNDAGRWQYGDQALMPGDPIDLQLNGVWIAGQIVSHDEFGDIFVAGNGEAYLTGLEGCAARAPGQASAEADADAAVEELLTAAGEAALVLKLIGQSCTNGKWRPQRTQSRLFAAIYHLRQLRGELPGSVSAAR